MNRRGVPRLKSLALERICIDIVRHGMKFQTLTEEERFQYRIFQTEFSDDALEVLNTRCAMRGYKAENSDFYNCWESRAECLDLIFNTFLRKIDMSKARFKDEIILAITEKCKDLLYFKTSERELDPHLYIPFFNSMQHLVHLNLYYCAFHSSETMEVIANSLTQLRTLNLRGTNVDDNGVFILCGHKRPLPVSGLGCCFVKNCEVNGTLKLRRLRLEITAISRAAIACVLTHMESMEDLTPNIHPDFTVTDVISEINEQRVQMGMSVSRMQLTRLECPKRVRNFGELFYAIPKLNFLRLNTSPETLQDLSSALATSDFDCLQELNIKSCCTHIIANEDFMTFWRKIGRQLKSLTIAPTFSRSLHESYVLVNPNDFRRILNMCPNLRELTIERASLLEPVDSKTGASGSGHLPNTFPCLENVQTLTIGLSSRSNLVLSEVSKIIRSAVNVRHLTLEIDESEDTLLNLLAQKSLLRLDTVSISRKPGERKVYWYRDGGKFQRL